MQENRSQIKKDTRETTGVNEKPDIIPQTTEDELIRPLLKAYPKHCEGKAHSNSVVASCNEDCSWIEHAQEYDDAFCFPYRYFWPLVMVTPESDLRRLDFVDGKNGMEKTVQ